MGTIILTVNDMKDRRRLKRNKLIYNDEAMIKILTRFFENIVKRDKWKREIQNI